MKTISMGLRVALISTSALSIAAIQPSAQAQTTIIDFDFDPLDMADGQQVTDEIDGLLIKNGSIGYEGGTKTGFRSRWGKDSINPNRLTPGAAFSGGFLTTKNFASSKNIRIDFDSPVSNLSFTVADIEGKERLSASVFDAQGNKLERKIIIGENVPKAGNPDAKNGSGILVSFNLDGISWLRLNPSKPSDPDAGIDYAIDNLAFEPSQAVPEPMSMAGLLAVGALGVGLLHKRRPMS